MRVDENLYDLALHHIGRNKKDVFVVIIGAMDGVSFDETRGYISVYGWKGLFVEPIPAQFNKLKALYDGTGSFCENSAISDHNGKIKMMTIDTSAIDSGVIHPCFGGMSSIYPPKNGLSSEGDKPVVEKYGSIVEVDCITPETLFNKYDIQEFDIISIDTEGHDWTVLKNIDINKYKPKVIRIEYINISETEQQEAIDFLVKHGYVYNIIGQNLDAVKKDYWESMSVQTKSVEISKPKIQNKNNITLVTGIWDLGRDALTEGWSRGFDHYREKFIQLLTNTKDTNLIVFIDKEHEDLVWQYRSRENTVVYHQPKEAFNSAFFPFYDQIQHIRKNPAWLNQVGWLSGSTQAKMEWYNPMVMSKMFMLHNAKCFNPFNSTYLYWIDGGITNTVHPGYFSHDKVIDKIPAAYSKFLFICFPYETQTEIHGFDISGMKKYANSDNVNRVARGGFFGGHIDYISQANEIYYGLLRDTLYSGYMGTEESIFTLMTYLHPDMFEFDMIQDNGLISTFFERIKNLDTNIYHAYLNTNNNVILYINAFNSPEQLQMVLDSFEKYDKNFLDKTQKILLNNSTKNNLFEKYDVISKKYNFEEIRKGNLGVCGARQLAAQHFKDSGAKYMFFFEDDMLLDLRKDLCAFGFSKYVYNLYDTLIKIMDTENYDFLKFSFSEFFGHNGEQWSWHNVPLAQKKEYFGDINRRPHTKFSKIKSLNQTPYAEGEVYYSNWPHIINQVGNQKLFLDTTWAHPYEQTWMSHIYTLTKQGKVNPAILLASPITHNRVHFYEKEERREN